VAPYGRFIILTDEHVPFALVSALREAGWLVHRVEDERDLGKGTLDDRIFAYAAERGWVWLSRDEAAVAYPAAWQRAGKRFTGMIVWSQRHHRAMSIRHVVLEIETLEHEEDPFAAGVRFIKP